MLKFRRRFATKDSRLVSMCMHIHIYVYVYAYNILMSSTFISMCILFSVLLCTIYI